MGNQGELWENFKKSKKSVVREGKCLKEKECGKSEKTVGREGKH